MAGYRKREGKWEVRIRRLNQKGISKTFVSKEDAQKWAREYEAKLEKGLFEDLTHANSISLRELLQQYCTEVSSTKRGFAEEKYKINKLCKDNIASFKLAKITPLKLRKFQDSWSLSHNPSTVNKYITLISVAIKFARQMLGIYLPNNPCDFVKRLKEPEFSDERISPEMGGDRGPSSIIKEVEPDPAITTVTPNAPSKDKKRKKKKEKEKSNLPFGKRVKYGIQDLFTRQNKQKAIYTGAGRTVKRKRQGRK